MSDLGTFTCDLCGEIHSKTITDEQAALEAEEKFPGKTGVPVISLCGVCCGMLDILSQHVSGRALMKRAGLAIPNV